MATDRDSTPEQMVSSFFSESSTALSDHSSEFAVEDAEAMISNYKPKDTKDVTKSVLSSFIRFLPTDGKQVLAEQIKTSDNNTLHALSNHLLTCILVPMKARGPTPAITPSPFINNNALKEAVAANMDESPSRKMQQRLKIDCLRRDNYQCLVTGVVDENAPEALASEGDVGPTELSHIISLSISQWEGNKNDHEVAQIWATLRTCFPSINMIPGDVNKHDNLMTLYQAAHYMFGMFRLALEPTGSLDEYKILLFERHNSVLKKLLPLPDSQGNRIVKFQSHDPAVDLPNPVLLETHAALAKILHASGMSEHIDHVLDDRKDILCLASDGSTDVERLLLAF